MEEWEQQTLMLLLSFLHDYYLVQRAEGFSGNTLGQLFGPVILRGSDGPLPLPFPEDVRAAAEVVDCMIIAFPVVFSDPSPCSSPYHKPPSRCCQLPTNPAYQHFWFENDAVHNVLYDYCSITIRTDFCQSMLEEFPVC